MAPHGRPRRRPEAPTTLHELTRRYAATALALSKAMGLPYTEAFLREHRESITTCYIQAGMEGLRLPPAVQLPSLGAVTHVTAEAEPPSVDLPLEDVSVTHITPEPEPDPDPLPLGEGEAPVAATNGQAPLPTHIPVGEGWPCAGVEITQLKPAQLHLVLARAGFRAHTDTAVIPLLAAVQSERAKRIERGKRRQGEGPPG